ncbi:hypothetical protein TWF481_002442 [Arthrobotrys musiformis]|uniref:Alpha box domain-containing protein n=1 Tax=Arthrobotrys musiformis TaxID=47236 RepID=A0AAV9VU95_9PEZI
MYPLRDESFTNGYYGHGYPQIFQPQQGYGLPIRNRAFPLLAESQEEFLKDKEFETGVSLPKSKNMLSVDPSYDTPGRNLPYIDRKCLDSVKPFERTFNLKSGTGVPQLKRFLAPTETLWRKRVNIGGVSIAPWRERECDNKDNLATHATTPIHVLIDGVPNKERPILEDDVVSVSGQKRKRQDENDSPRKKRAVNAWIAYRTYHQTLFKPQHHQSEVSGKIKALYDNISNEDKAKWCDVAREYTQGRDSFPGASRAWLSGMLATIVARAGLGQLKSDSGTEVLPPPLVELPSTLSPATLHTPRNIAESKKRARESGEPEFGRVPKIARLIFEEKRKRLRETEEVLVEEPKAKKMRILMGEQTFQNPNFNMARDNQRSGGSSKNPGAGVSRASTPDSTPDSIFDSSEYITPDTSFEDISDELEDAGNDLGNPDNPTKGASNKLQIDDILDDVYDTLNKVQSDPGELNGLEGELEEVESILEELDDKMDQSMDNSEDSTNHLDHGFNGPQNNVDNQLDSSIAINLSRVYDNINNLDSSISNLNTLEEVNEKMDYINKDTDNININTYDQNNFSNNQSNDRSTVPENVSKTAIPTSAITLLSSTEGGESAAPALEHDASDSDASSATSEIFSSFEKTSNSDTSFESDTSGQDLGIPEGGNILPDFEDGCGLFGAGNFLTGDEPLPVSQFSKSRACSPTQISPVIQDKPLQMTENSFGDAHEILPLLSYPAFKDNISQPTLSELEDGLESELFPDDSDVDEPLYMSPPPEARASSPDIILPDFEDVVEPQDDRNSFDEFDHNSFDDFDDDVASSSNIDFHDDRSSPLSSPPQSGSNSPRDVPNYQTVSAIQRMYECFSSIEDLIERYRDPAVAAALFMDNPVVLSTTPKLDNEEQPHERKRQKWKLD